MEWPSRAGRTVFQGARSGTQNSSSCELSQPMGKTEFSYLLDRVCSIFSGAGKFCLAHGLRQLTRA